MTKDRVGSSTFDFSYLNAISPVFSCKCRDMLLVLDVNLHHTKKGIPAALNIVGCSMFSYSCSITYVTMYSNESI